MCEQREAVWGWMDGRAGEQWQLRIGVGGGGPSGSETSTGPRIRGKKSGSVFKCARAATQAGERRSPGICRGTALERMQVRQRPWIRTIFAQHEGEY